MQRFQEFKALVENQTERRIRALRSNNRGEYTSKEFDEYCRQEGIRRQLTVPYTPEQNEVVESKNRSIVGAARAMISHFLSFFGQRHVVQLFTFRTRAPIVPWGTRLLRRCSQARSLR